MTDNTNTDDNRGNGRQPIRAHATLSCGSDDWSAHLINFSQDGALIAVTDEHNIQTDSEVTLDIEINAAEKLQMLGKVAHVKEHYVGVDCKPQSERDAALLRDIITRLEEGDSIPVEY